LLDPLQILVQGHRFLWVKMGLG